jgi:hypothetical protein
MAKEKDLEPTAADNSTRNEGTPPCTDPETGLIRDSGSFKLKIISRNGQEYYEVDSKTLGTPKLIGNDATMNDLITKQVDVAHVPYVKAESDPTKQVVQGNPALKDNITKPVDVANAKTEPHVAYCGTYYVNLHVFK